MRFLLSDSLVGTFPKGLLIFILDIKDFYAGIVIIYEKEGL